MGIDGSFWFLPRLLKLKLPKQRLVYSILFLLIVIIFIVIFFASNNKAEQDISQIQNNKIDQSINYEQYFQNATPLQKYLFTHCPKEGNTYIGNIEDVDAFPLKINSSNNQYSITSINCDGQISRGKIYLSIEDHNSKNIHKYILYDDHSDNLNYGHTPGIRADRMSFVYQDIDNNIFVYMYLPSEIKDSISVQLRGIVDTRVFNNNSDDFVYIQYDSEAIPADNQTLKDLLNPFMIEITTEPYIGAFVLSPIEDRDYKLAIINHFFSKDNSDGQKAIDEVVSALTIFEQ